jgi:hypothetical protein
MAKKVKWYLYRNPKTGGEIKVETADEFDAAEKKKELVEAGYHLMETIDPTEINEGAK